VDPGFAGSDGANQALEFLRAHPCLPTIGFFPLSAPNLHLALLLSRSGLREAFTYPIAARKTRLKRSVDTLTSSTAVAVFLNVIEPSLGKLPPRAMRTIQDLFIRPHRYNSAEDLAAGSHMCVRQLYRRLAAAHLSSPKKLLLAAKVLRGASYLLDREVSIKSASDKLGFRGRRAFARHTLEIFRCNPTKLRASSDDEEIAIHVLEWVNKPSKRAQKTARR
jgi:AraC-like DNA-binding protein